MSFPVLRSIDGGGDSQILFMEGSYADYQADRRKRLGDDADVPKRIKYRKLTRN